MIPDNIIEYDNNLNLSYIDPNDLNQEILDNVKDDELRTLVEYISNEAIVDNYHDLLNKIVLFDIKLGFLYTSIARPKTTTREIVYHYKKDLETLYYDIKFYLEDYHEQKYFSKLWSHVSVYDIWSIASTEDKLKILESENFYDILNKLESEIQY